MVLEFDTELYHNRNLVETMFSVLKRKYSEEIRQKLLESIKISKFKLSVHNIDIPDKVILAVEIRISTEPKY